MQTSRNGRVLHMANFVTSEDDSRLDRRRLPLSFSLLFSLARPRLGLRGAALWLPQIRLNIRVKREHVVRQSETQPTDRQLLLPYVWLFDMILSVASCLPSKKSNYWLPDHKFQISTDWTHLVN